MFKGERQVEQDSSVKTHELSVVVLDLSQRALVGAFDGSFLFKDFQELDDNGFPGISHEFRAIHLGARQNLGIHPMKVLARLSHPTKSMDAYAVEVTHAVNYRDFTVRRFEIDEVEEIIGKAIANPETASMNVDDAHVVQSALDIPKVRKALS
jgi:hypothetical protein